MLLFCKLLGLFKKEEFCKFAAFSSVSNPCELVNISRHLGPQKSLAFMDANCKIPGLLAEILHQMQ